MMRLKFTRRPNPVLPEHRPIYKIAQLLLILHYSRGGKSSLLRLHLLNWIVKSQSRIDSLCKGLESGSLLFLTWGFDPAVAIAIRFALAEKLVSETSTGYKIEPKGKIFVNDFMKDTALLHLERTALSGVGTSVTERMVESIAKDWK